MLFLHIKQLLLTRDGNLVLTRLIDMEEKLFGDKSMLSLGFVPLLEPAPERRPCLHAVAGTASQLPIHTLVHCD